MVWIYLIALVFFLLSIAGGYKKLVFLDQIRLRNLLVCFLLILSVFLLLQWLFLIDAFTQDIAGAFMAVSYSSVGGFFAGSAIRQYLNKKRSGKVLYSHQSFMTNILPVLVALGLILFGFQRTSLLGDLPVTPIRLCSGMSLMMIGIWGFTLRLVPQFCDSGIILLDRRIQWSDFVAYNWISERVLEIEYELDDSIRVFQTMIPDDDQLEAESLLREKLLEKYAKEKDPVNKEK